MSCPDCGTKWESGPFCPGCYLSQEDIAEHVAVLESIVDRQLREAETERELTKGEREWRRFLNG